MSTKFNASFDNVVSTMYISSFRYWIAVYSNESGNLSFSSEPHGSGGLNCSRERTQLQTEGGVLR